MPVAGSGESGVALTNDARTVATSSVKAMTGTANEAPQARSLTIRRVPPRTPMSAHDSAPVPTTSRRISPR